MQASSISDFLKSYYMEIMPDNGNKNFMNDVKLIDLLISSGNIVVIIDGLDEISSVLKEDFILLDFIDTIFEMQKILGHAKVILASRTTFWNQHILLNKLETYKYNILEIQGFSEDDVKKYFQQYFGKNDNLRYSKAMDELKNTPFIDDNGFYWPYPVHIIADEIGENGDFTISNKILNSKYPLNQTNKNEFLIYLMIQRDINRHNLNMEFDDFLELFYEIIFRHHGVITSDELQFYIGTILPNSRLNVNILSYNPLLNYTNDKHFKVVDFLQDHFMYIFLNDGVYKNVSEDAFIHMLAKYYNGTNKMINKLSLVLNVDVVEKYILNIISEFVKLVKKTEIETVQNFV